MESESHPPSASPGAAAAPAGDAFWSRFRELAPPDANVTYLSLKRKLVAEFGEDAYEPHKREVHETLYYRQQRSHDGGPPRGKEGKASVADFELLSVVGRGGYGKVVQARHRCSGAVFAIKMLRKSKLERRKQIERTLTERLILAKVHHPFVVQLHWAFQTKEKLYLVLDYVPGGDLFTRLRRDGVFTLHRAREYACQVILALEHLHSLGIVYRDLKPENILIAPDGFIKLTDFGLSRCTSPVTLHWLTTLRGVGTADAAAPPPNPQCALDHGGEEDDGSTGPSSPASAPASSTLGSTPTRRPSSHALHNTHSFCGTEIYSKCGISSRPHKSMCASDPVSRAALLSSQWRPRSCSR